MTKRKIFCTITAVLIFLTAITFLNVPSAMASSSDDVLVYGGPNSQREVSIAANPLNPDNIVVGFNDWVTSDRCVASYAYSIDGGATWMYGARLPRGALAGEPFCDPWLAFDNEGYCYYVALSASGRHEVFVCVAAPNADGNAGPLGFGDPQIVDAGDKHNDKPAIAVDRTGGPHDGTIYVVWSRSPEPMMEYGFRIWFRRGRRGVGASTITWDPPQWVGPATFTQGAQVAVGPNGEVYVAYQRQTSPYLDTADAQLFSYSTDGGNTWQKDIYVSSITPVEQYVSGPTRWARHTSFPTLGVSQVTGAIFIAWADRRYGDDDILLSRSTDGGDTWHAVPKRVNIDPIGNGLDQWLPALTVNSRGVLDIIFYDRRNDPHNELTMLYVARSHNEGDTFLNVPISDTTTNPYALTGWPCMGDYLGIDSIGNTTYVSWTDGRNANLEPRDYNTDIYFSKFENLVKIPSYFPVVFINASICLFSYIPPWSKPIRVPMNLLSIEGFNETVELNVLGVPSGVDYILEPASGVPPFETTLTLNMSKGAAEGTYDIEIAASYNNREVTSTIEVVITSTPYILPETAIANPGDVITLEGHGFTVDSPYRVFFDGKLLKTGNVGTTGTIFTEIQIPTDTPEGKHTIYVKDEGGAAASATLSTLRGDEEEEWIFKQHDVAVINVTPWKTIVAQGMPTKMNVTVANQGSYTEIFNVTLEASRDDIGVTNIGLYGSATGGWGFTAGKISSPGPLITVNQGDLVNLTLTSADGITHNFFVDYNGDTNPSPGEPRSPDFTTTINYQFSADILGTFIYYCQYHKGTMYGSLIVNTPPTITSEIEKEEISLNNATSTTIAFTWNTTGWAKGNYTISAVADAVPGETDTEDNNLTNGWVIIAMVGDLTGPEGWPDGKVDMRDVGAVAKLFGTGYPHPLYDPNYDFDGNGKIDMKDIGIAAKNFGCIDP